MVLLSTTLVACEEGFNLNITPEAELYFEITDAQGNPQPNAVVYLFGFEGPYEDYIAQNPDGSDQITPNIPAENVAVADGSGVAFFSARALEGSSFQENDQWIYRPNSLYFRVQAVNESSGTKVFLTNDNDVFKLSFDELKSGDFLTEYVDVVVKE